MCLDSVKPKFDSSTENKKEKRKILQRKLKDDVVQEMRLIIKNYVKKKSCSLRVKVCVWSQLLGRMRQEACLSLGIQDPVWAEYLQTNFKHRMWTGQGKNVYLVHKRLHI